MCSGGSEPQFTTSLWLDPLDPVVWPDRGFRCGVRAIFVWEATAEPRAALEELWKRGKRGNRGK